MKPRSRTNPASLLPLVALLVVVLECQGLTQQVPTGSSEQSPQVTIPNRPASPLFKGEQGKQRSEIGFAPASRTVTIKLHVEDPSGYFIPNLRPENFAVYEDGVRQKNASVQIEYAPVSVALLMELGARYHELSKVLGTEVPQAGRKLLDVLGRDDKIAVFTYDSQLETLCDFSQSHEGLANLFDRLTPPPISEANLFDALLETFNRMRGVGGRKAVIAISSGIDTFSKTTYQQALQAVQASGAPLYTIGLGQFMQQEAAIYGSTAPFARIDWNQAEKQLEAQAKASGGRAYLPQSQIEIPAIYDDIMENLRVRYVITYVSSNRAASGPPRQVRVELIDPGTGAPLRIRDSSGKPVTAKVFVQESYGPSAASGG